MKIFDFDGTLVDSNGVWGQVDLEFLSQRGKEATQEYLEFLSHAIFPTAADFTKEYYQLDESPESIMDAWLELARDAYAYQVPLKPGAVEYIRQCLDKGESIALFTAGVPELCYLALERHGLDRYFEHIVFAQELGCEKRDPKAFALLTQQLGVSPADCILFDDAPKNCLAARNAGMQVVGVLDPYFAMFEEEVIANSHRVIRSFTELLHPAEDI